MRARDNRRQRLYDAERAATYTDSAAATKYLRNGAKVASTGSVAIEACQHYVDHVTNSAWFQRRWGRKSLTVRHKVYGSATASSCGSIVSLPPWAREEWTILHEVAHCVTAAQHAAHGPEFAAAFLTLVRQQMGKASYDSLRAAMRERRVKIGPLVKPDPRYAQRVVPRATIEARRAKADREAKARARTRAAEERAARERRLTGYSARRENAEAIRLLVRAGHFGPAGSAGRKAALATAKALESAAMSGALYAARRQT